MVYYLKYRPQILADLDNREVADLIAKYLTRGDIPHAFLFIGPKGTGKTSTARIVAKSINCEKSKEGQACGKCNNCLEIAKGGNLDVLEIDAASNRGIDEIRDLREKIKLAPTNLKYKVYIIDEVHMLTHEAFNALLKTIEEPPRHAVFILATTEAHKVPATIASRCVQINFHKATDSEIVNSLKRIVTGEKLDIDDKVLLAIAKASDGAFRDAAKILERASLSNNKITGEEVNKIIGFVETKQINDFLKGLKEKKTAELFEMIRELSREGKNMQQFFISILSQMEQLLVDSFKDGKDFSWKRDELILAIKLFSQSFTAAKGAIIPTLPFELAVVEYCESHSSNIDVVNEVIPQVIKTKTDVISPSVDPIASKWVELLEGLKPFNHSIVGVLRSCRPIALTDNELTIEAKYKFHAERLSDMKIRELIAKVVKNVLGFDVKVNIILKK